MENSRLRQCAPYRRVYCELILPCIFLNLAGIRAISRSPIKKYQLGSRAGIQHRHLGPDTPLSFRFAFRFAFVCWS